MSPRLRLPRIGRATAPTEGDATTAASDGTGPIEPSAAAPQTHVAAQSAARVVEVSAEAGAPIAAGAAVETSASAGPVVTTATALEDGLDKMAGYGHAVLSWVAEDGYPVNVDVEIEVKPIEGTVRFSEPPGFHISPGSAVAGVHRTVNALRSRNFLTSQRRSTSS